MYSRHRMFYLRGRNESEMHVFANIDIWAEGAGSRD
jgi:hypothetical protein